MTDTRYRPPTKVHSTVIQFKSMVVRADPEFETKKRREPFYEFSRRTFYGNNATSGPYADE
jgi:hypothetical protein